MPTLEAPTEICIEERSILVDGAAVHYRTAGAGRPLLLLHGLIGSGQTWRLNMEPLAEHAQVYAIDFVNMGKSERVPGLDAGMEATADRVAALMDALGLDKADLAAHSHGGAIAMMLAARHPERIGKLILFAPANPFCESGSSHVRFFQTTVGRWLGRRAPVLPRLVQATAMRRMYGDPTRMAAGTLEQYTEDLHVPGTMDHILEILAGWFDDMGQLSTALGRLATKPVLLVWGELDRAVSLPSAHRLQKMLRRSELLVIPGAGHLPFEEMPEMVNRVMQEWLGRGRGFSGPISAQ